MDKILDPAQIRNADILAFIRAHKITTAEDIISGIMNLNEEILSAWDTTDRLLKEQIIKHTDHFGILYYMDGSSLTGLFAGAIHDLKALPSEATSQQKEKIHTRVDLLYRTSKQVLHYSTAMTLIGKETEVNKLSLLVNDYETHVKRISVQAEMTRDAASQPKKGRPFLLRVISFFSSLFSLFSKSDIPEEEYPAQFASGPNPGAPHGTGTRNERHQRQGEFKERTDRRALGPDRDQARQ